MFVKTLTATAAAIALTAVPAVACGQHQGHDMGDHAMAPATAPAAPATTAAPAKDVKTISIAVTDDGFVPANLRVKAGQKVRLVITRKVERTCATEIVIKDQGIHQPLPLNQPVAVEFTPKKAGTLRYACAMDMIAGTIAVN
ncbi:MAG TPA: cupredoxin domain-containing protein [Anaeromyxobacteraceae bacterium]|nr:cupredoxin domain-containing protein [Anaeromyxobacteraceae bacterium]